MVRKKNKDCENYSFDYSTLVALDSFIESEIRSHYVWATRMIADGKITKQQAGFKRAMLLSIQKLIKKVINCELPVKPQMNLFDVSKYERKEF